MNVFVAGATGATGRLLVEQLLERGCWVRVVVRRRESLPAAVRNHANLSVSTASILDLTPQELARHVAGCEAVASCLGHVPNLRGIWGPPYRLVTEAVQRLCAAVEAGNPPAPVRFVLMSSTGVRNPLQDNPTSAAHKVAIGLLRALVPPHRDNETAAAFLRDTLGTSSGVVEWAMVRPDKLVDLPEVTPYELKPSPTQDPLFAAGDTSRVNVAHVMAELMAGEALWRTWKHQTPVVYNREE